MKYVVMADGKGTRWANYQGIPKHLIEINGESLLERIVRLLKKYDRECEIIITSHDSRYEIKGAKRYEPRNNNIEIDRFTYELIEDDICFLYGDTYYSEEAIITIVNESLGDITFFGTSKSIVAIKVNNSEVFKYHIDKVKELYLNGKIQECIGWQVYQSYEDIPFGTKKIVNDFVIVDKTTRDFNSPVDFEEISI